MTAAAAIQQAAGTSPAELAGAALIALPIVALIVWVSWGWEGKR